MSIVAASSQKVENSNQLSQGAFSEEGVRKRVTTAAVIPHITRVPVTSKEMTLIDSHAATQHEDLEVGFLDEEATRKKIMQLNTANKILRCVFLFLPVFIKFLMSKSNLSPYLFILGGSLAMIACGEQLTKIDREMQTLSRKG